MRAGAWPPTEKAPLESVLNCWLIRGSHVVHRVENLRSPKKRTWTGLVMAPSTAELYTPRRNIHGPKCAHSGLRKNMVSFAEKSGKTAEKSGIRTSPRDAVSRTAPTTRTTLDSVNLLASRPPPALPQSWARPPLLRVMGRPTITGWAGPRPLHP